MEAEPALLTFDQIRPPRFILREIDRNSLDFMQIRDSVAKDGYLTPVTVIPHPDGGYELMCGWCRYNAGLDAGKKVIPALIRYDIETDTQFRVAQIIENLIRKETTKVEYAAYLKSLQQHLSIDEIAVMVNHDRTWVYRQLDLLNLRPECQELLRKRELPLSNAYHLARLLPEDQGEHFRKAIELPTKEFEKFVNTFRTANKLVIEKKMGQAWAKQLAAKLAALLPPAP